MRGIGAGVQTGNLNNNEIKTKQNKKNKKQSRQPIKYGSELHRKSSSRGGGRERKNVVMTEKGWENMAVVAHRFSRDSGSSFCPSTLNLKRN